MIFIHATAVAINGMGVLIMGPPGAGKSDLALRLIDQPGFGLGGALLTAELVADDQTLVRVSDGALIASAPEALAGLMEIRGQGIVRLAARPSARLVLAVTLTPAAEIERMPVDQYTDILGVRLSAISIDATGASAPARLRAALAGVVIRG